MKKWLHCIRRLSTATPIVPFGNNKDAPRLRAAQFCGCDPKVYIQEFSLYANHVRIQYIIETYMQYL